MDTTQINVIKTISNW